MAASVGIGFQCVQCAAEGGFRALTGRPGAGRPNGPGARRIRAALGAGRPTAARHVHGNAIGRAGRRGRRPLPRHHMVTRRIRRMGGSRLSRPRRVHCVPL